MRCALNTFLAKVLILVLVEDGLEEVNGTLLCRQLPVLILVLMEDGLEGEDIDCLKVNNLS